MSPQVLFKVCISTVCGSIQYKHHEIAENLHCRIVSVHRSTILLKIHSPEYKVSASGIMTQPMNPEYLSELMYPSMIFNFVIQRAVKQP